MGRALRWSAGTLAGVVGVALLLVGAGLFLTRTGPGQRLVLDRAIAFLAGRIDGELTVGGIRSSGLLRGVTLTDISLTGPGGRPFAEIDTLEVRYALGALLAGELRIDEVRLAGPRVVLEPLPEGVRTGGEDALNVMALFRVGGEKAPDGASPGEPTLRLAFDRVQIERGEVTVRTLIPEEGSGTDAPPEEAEDEAGQMVAPLRARTVPEIGEVTELRFTELSGEVRELSILEPGRPGQRARIHRLSGLAAVFEEPFRVEELRGELAIDPEELRLSVERLRLPGTELSGRYAMALGAPDVNLAVEVDARTLQLRDFRFVVPTLPEATGTLRGAFRLNEEGVQIDLAAADLMSGRSRARASGGVQIAAGGGGVRITGGDVEFLPLGAEFVQSFLSDPIGVDGTFRGVVRADGPLDALAVGAQLTLEGGGRGATSLLAAGRLHLGDGQPGATALSVTATALDYGRIGDLVPAFRLRGQGRVDATLSGRYGGVGDPLAVTLTATHRSVGGETSSVRLAGTVAGEGEGVVLDLEAEVEPLSLSGLARDWPGIPLEGEVRGELSARGGLRALEIALALDTPAGRIEAEGRANALDPAEGYALRASVADFDVALLASGVPAGTVLTGRAEVEGRGFDPASLSAAFRVALEASTIAGVPLEGASATARVGDGHLTVAALELRSSAVRLNGAGALALQSPGGAILRPGESADDSIWTAPDGGGLPSLPPLALPGAADPLPALYLEVQESDLSRLRPWLMPGATIARDTLSPIEEELLRVSGVDPDTLPTLESITLTGQVRGELVLRGALSDFRVDGVLALQGVQYGANRIDSGRLAVSLRDPLAGARNVALRLDGVGMAAVGRTFDEGGAFLGVREGAGVVAARLLREPAEAGASPAVDEQEIRLAADFRTGPGGALDARLNELSLRSEDGLWVLEQPARVVRDSLVIEVAGFRLNRPDPSGVRIDLDLRIPRDGEIQGLLVARRVDLARLLSLLQIEADLAGEMELTVELGGTTAAPVLDGEVAVAGLRLDSVALDFLAGDVAYADRILRSELRAWEGGREILSGSITIPADLALAGAGERFPDEPIAGEVQVQAFPAAVALSLLEVLEAVEGELTGAIQLGGTLRGLRPEGELRLSGGAATVPEVGVRYTNVFLEALLDGSGVIRIDGGARARGEARVAGYVDISDLSDPAFDLAVTLAGFQGADRRDVQARVGGDARLSGRFRDPLITGVLRVEQANLFLDEFVRASTVVDLTDPAFFDVVDTTLVSVRPILEASQNPFLQNLRMDVALTIERDVWLRSNQINVEIGGELSTLFNRPRKEIVLVGQLQAVRGSYNGFGRRFEIREGIVEFNGTPGLNPRLDIQAVTRVRSDDDLLSIVAALEGTLLQPRVSLGSDSDPDLASSELASYLIFGRPSSFLSEGERSIVGGATGAGLSLGLGIWANQLGSAVAQQVGIDYFAITTAAEADVLGQGAFRGSVAATQFELGQYLSDDVFLALVLRPLSSFGEGTQSQFSGARVEWRFSDSWTAEAFIEDRFSRAGFSGFRQLGFTAAKALGFLIYRDWGY